MTRRSSNRRTPKLPLRTLRPATPAKADYFTMLAVQACNDTELLPPRYAALLDDRGKLQETIQSVSAATERRPPERRPQPQGVR